MSQTKHHTKPLSSKTDILTKNMFYNFKAPKQNEAMSQLKET